MQKITRREMMKRAAATAAAIAAPTIIPAAALGKDGAVAPSERIVMGAIGIGGRGAGVLSWMLGEKDMQFVAICDIRKSRREFVKNMADAKYGNKDCVMYRDLREFLAERGDIDALLIATGDRWHALASVLAMRAGKDVYCEKPGTMTVAEGQALRDAARRYGRVFQTGTQRRSEAKFVAATQLARTGRLGKLHTVRAHLASWTPTPKFNWLPAEPEPPKDETDWDLWLGPCPWRPYNSGYVRGGWRGYYDFHSGDIGEWGSHTINQCQMVLDADDTSAIEYVHPGNDTGEGMVCRYANGVKMILQRTGWRGSCGVTFEGDGGWVSVADGYERPDVSSPALLEEGNKLVRDYVAQTQRSLNHVRDFFDCVKSRRLPVSHAEAAHRSMTTCHAANICLWLGRSLKWDPAKEQFINDPEANRFLSRAMREPWQL
ncbi:MAG: Gfo/Idh/MocA family oxidoreductase [Planctomycetota bacterium]